MIKGEVYEVRILRETLNFDIFIQISRMIGGAVCVGGGFGQLCHAFLPSKGDGVTLVFVHIFVCYVRIPRCYMQVEVVNFILLLLLRISLNSYFPENFNFLISLN